MRYQAGRCVCRCAAILVRFTVNGASTEPSTAEFGRPFLSSPMLIPARWTVRSAYCQILSASGIA